MSGCLRPSSFTGDPAVLLILDEARRTIAKRRADDPAFTGSPFGFSTCAPTRLIPMEPTSELRLLRSMRGQCLRVTDWDEAQTGLATKAWDLMVIDSRRSQHQGLTGPLQRHLRGMPAPLIVRYTADATQAAANLGLAFGQANTPVELIHTAIDIFQRQ